MWSGHLAPGLSQSNLNDCLLLNRELFGKRLIYRLGGDRAPRKPTLIHREVFRVADNDRAFDDVLQLPNIAGPWIRLEQFQSSKSRSLPSICSAMKAKHVERRIFIDANHSSWKTEVGEMHSKTEPVGVPPALTD